MNAGQEPASLIARARNGDERAWGVLIELYTPLIWSTCRRYRLSAADAEDIGQSVWLSLIRQLDQIRDPAALPGWLATTARRACLRLLRMAEVPLRTPDGALGTVDGPLCTADGPLWQPDEPVGQTLLAAERHAAVRAAFADLPICHQRLISMLVADPPVPYAEISIRLGIPVGSIGPIRARCLARVRRHPAVAALINADGGDGRRAA